MDKIKDQNAEENTPNPNTQATNSPENSSTSSSSSSTVINDNDQPATDAKTDNGLQAKEKRKQTVDQAARPSAVSASMQLQSPRMSAFSDASRLPASVFTRPGTPGDWSMASNESLFSIHVGNFMFRSGELTRLEQDLVDTAAFARASEAFDDAYFFNEIRAGEGHHPITRSHVSRHSFQFPVLPEGSDGRWMISSPKMLEPRRQRAMENMLHAPQSQPIMHIIRRRKQPPRFEAKPKNYSRVLSRLFSFSCCTPCRRHES